LNEDIDDHDYRVDIRLISIVNNLIKNSVEASLDGYNIEVSVTLKDAELVIIVSDQGKGMTKEFIDNQLFEPFTTLKGHMGLGIGMYQVKEIITELRGFVIVESEVAQGTKVTLTLPAENDLDVE
jgi:signal transduction histidine kinase